MNILLVDDQNIFLDSLSLVIKQAFPSSNVFKALSGRLAIDMLPEAKPTVILLDVNMPGMNGLEVAEHITKHYPAIKIVMLTNITGRAIVLSSMKIVHGFLFKDVGAPDIKNAIEAVLSGKKYFCSNANQMIIKNVNELDKLPYVQFTKIEIDIVEMLKAGKTSKQIAKTLGLKERTVNHHREELLKKTKTKNSHELIAFAFANALIQI